MRVLNSLDYTVISAYMIIIFTIGIVFTKRASNSMDEFFIGGRSMPWWLLGISMAATNFSIDTPIAATKFIFQEGISGIWFMWASAISAIIVTFFFSKLWRRSKVLTDAEIIERRYSGKSSEFLRLFKGVYFGVIFNAFIMGWVFLSLSKVLAGVTDLNIELTLWVTVVIVFVYSVASGFYGVVITDFFQYFLALIGSIFLAVYSLDRVGGVSGLLTRINSDATIHNSVLDFIPSFSEGSAMSLSVFLSYIFVQWWAHKYADGGGKHIQRLLSAKDESHAFRGSALYTVLTYSLQIWPWIITALCAMVLFKDLGDAEMAYPKMMALVLPNGLLGLVVVCLVGAFMSTIDTHLNLGASYIVNDIYKRFIAPNKSNKHYVLISRIMMGILLILAVIISKNMTSVGGAWKFLLTFASGAGAVWILRWFWWRINAWSEISAMLTSGVSATTIAILRPEWNYSEKLLTTVLISTVVWIIVTILTEKVSDEKLRSFVEQVKPPIAGWQSIYKKYNIEKGEPLKTGLINTFLGLVVFFCFNFSLGHFILKSAWFGAALLAISLIGSFILYKRVRQSL